MGKWKISGVEETEVFTTQHGEIGISQEGARGESPAMVVVLRELLPRLIKNLEAAAIELDRTGSKII